MKYVFSSLLGMLTFALTAQTKPLVSAQQIEELKESSWVKSIAFDNVTPESASVNIKTSEINKDGSEILIVPEKGGIWYSSNGGFSFKPIFDHQITQKVTEIAVDWSQDIIWAATDMGLFQSNDKGITWVSSGLSNVKNISKILINPVDSKVVVVGAEGASYGADNQRGIFKTNDGGKTWQHVLNSGTKAGVIDLESARNSDVIYVSVWDQDNSLWDMNTAGSKTGIYKSEDYGTTWKQITKSNNGFPKNGEIGRIGIAVYDKDRLFAVVDNQNTFIEKKEESLEKKQSVLLQPEELKEMNSADFESIPNTKLNAFIYTYNLQGKYTAERLKSLIKSGVTTPSKILKKIGVSLQRTKGAEVYKSEDGGNTWDKTHQEALPELYYHKGDKFASIAVNPHNSKEIYIGGVALLKSVDGGLSWKSLYLNDLNNGVNHINITDSGKRLFFSNGKQFLTSYNDGESWESLPLPQIGKFNNVDISTGYPKRVYLSSDNRIYRSELTNDKSVDYQHKNFSAGTVKSSNKGNLYLTNSYGDISKVSWKDEKPTPLVVEDIKELVRYGKKIPLIVSSVNKDIVYVGSNKLHLSMNKGKNWRTISEDLTNGDKNGNQAYGTLTTISESPFHFGVIYTGSDDGRVHITQNGGVTWEVIYNAFPKVLSVATVMASKHHQSRVYTILNGEASEDHQPYIFKSDDYGKTWSDLKSNLPQIALTTLLEDSDNSELLYLGTEKGLYVSFDGGERWHLFSSGIPLSEITDIAYQPETNELWVTTLGMGVYKANVSYLRELSAAVQKQTFYPFDENITVKYSSQWGNRWNIWQKVQSPKVNFHVFSSKDDMQLSVKVYKDGVLLNVFNHSLSKGFNTLDYDLTVSSVGKVSYEKKLNKIILTKATDGKYYLPKGTYKIEFSGDDFLEERNLIID